MHWSREDSAQHRFLYPGLDTLTFALKPHPVIYSIHWLHDPALQAPPMFQDTDIIFIRSFNESFRMYPCFNQGLRLFPIHQSQDSETCPRRSAKMRHINLQEASLTRLYPLSPPQVAPQHTTISILLFHPNTTPHFITVTCQESPWAPETKTLAADHIT